MLDITIFIDNCLHKLVTWNIFLRLFSILGWISWNWVSVFVNMSCCDLFVDVYCITVWQLLSFNEAVSWNVFLRIFAVFCWISWNFISVFILVTSLHFFVDMFCVTVWKFLSLYEAVTWDIFLRLFTVFCWVTWNWFTIFVYKRSNWGYSWCVSCRNFCSVNIFTHNCH